MSTQQVVRREVVSFRVTEDELVEINAAVPAGQTRAEFIKEAVFRGIRAGKQKGKSRG